RSNNALLLTAPARPDDSGTSEWAIHVPLQPFKRRMVRAHHDWMATVAARYPGVPVPETLFAGRAAGLEVAAARRLRGLDGTELTGDARRTARMFEDVCEALARLLDAEPTTVDDALWGSLLETRFERVLVHVTNADTRRRLEEMIQRLRDALLGQSLRLGMYHADLRPKHVKTDAQGRLVGLMDWGASEERFLPLVDLLQLVIHQRSQELGGRFGAAWRAVKDPAARRPHEARALERYADLAGLEVTATDALLDAFPLFVAGMAERNWDYSRPHWVQRQFGL
ncbi:MAG: phosphotransferase, partial [Planctomycetota bacterium]|nr:phosphotransferase [Planctomycetota bacterium]